MAKSKPEDEALVKAAHSLNKSVARSGEKFRGWLASRVQRLRKFPRKVWPWNGADRVFYERLEEYVSVSTKLGIQLQDLVVALQSQKLGLTSRIVELEDRLRRCEKEYPGLIASLSSEVSRLRKATEKVSGSPSA